MGQTKIIDTTIPSLFEIDQTFQDPRFMKVRIAVMHSGSNLNGSNFPKKTIANAKDTFANAAVLADVVEYEDEKGETHLDYAGHEMTLQQDKFNPDQMRTIYKQKVVGVIPESNNWALEYDEKNDWYYPVVDALIYRDYGNYVSDILEERGGKTDVSAEIYCPDISVDAKSGEIVVNQMILSGVTLLGSQVKPAMQGANCQVFSLDGDDKQQQLIDIMRELKDSFDKYTALHDNAQNSQKGGKPLTKLEELKNKFNVTDEDIDFETEGLSDEEIEAKFNEKFGDHSDPEPDEKTESDADPTPADNSADQPDSTDPDEGTEPDEPADPEPEDPETHSREFSIGTKQFSVSLSDIQYSIEGLVNETYASQDGSYYSCDVYLDDKTLIMHNWADGKSYRQSFKVRNDQYSLVGDRVEVHPVWMTQDEEKSFDNMKNNYSSISEELNKYHEEPKKAEILNSEVYSTLSEDKDFIKLKDEHFDMSVEEVQKKADEILLNSVKQHKFSYSTSEGKKTTTVKPLPISKKSKRNFGTLFDGII